VSNLLSNTASLPNLKSSVNPFPAIILPAGHRYFEDCVKECYARLIEWSMSTKGFTSLFCTHTFKNYERPRPAVKKYEEWACRLGQALKDRGGDHLRWILSKEWQVRGVIHFHSIVQGVGLDRLSRKSWEDRWEALHRNCGFCRIYPAIEKSAPYLAKYCSNSFDDAIEWGGTWQGFKAPASVSCGHSLASFRGSHPAR